MNDCPNGDVRDLLPDLLHGRLDAVTRARVESHVLHCDECRAELDLLRDLRATMQVTPHVDVQAVSAAIRPYRPATRRSWVGWRTAAAVTLIVAGSSSLIVARRGSSPLEDSAVVAQEVVPSSVAARELAVGGGALNELSDRDLAKLLDEIQSMDVLPPADVEPSSMSPMSPRSVR
ncbi:MAG TPA: zf-HC2 domain-containing protein [Gemmatimonadaceae bacterium]